MNIKPFQWSGDDPNSKDNLVRLRSIIDASRHTAAFGAEGIIRSLAQNKDVLDVGCVEHGPAYWDQPHWRHKVLCESAKSCLGVDILTEGVNELRRRGYNVLLVDATSDHDLGHRFDLVMIGDVIEHVGRPEDLLRFARRHLNVNGKIVVTTPNPWYLGHTLTASWRGSVVPNTDHIGWYCPATIASLAGRVDLSLTQWRPVLPLWQGWHRSVLNWLTKFFPRSLAFAPTLVYVLSTPTVLDS